MNYKTEAERWQKHFETIPMKNGLYAPLYKRSEHETDEETYSLMCSVVLYSEVIKQFEKKLKRL